MGDASRYARGCLIYATVFSDASRSRFYCTQDIFAEHSEPGKQIEILVVTFIADIQLVFNINLVLIVLERLVSI